MDKDLFLKIASELEDLDLDDFSYDYKGKKYGFKEVGDNSWDDQGKYQYKTEQGQLIEMDESYREVQSFNFGVSRKIQRSGSYFSDYYYDKDPYELFEITEDLIPEKIIPAHTEEKWNKLSVN